MKEGIMNVKDVPTMTVVQSGKSGGKGPLDKMESVLQSNQSSYRNFSVGTTTTATQDRNTSIMTTSGHPVGGRHSQYSKMPRDSNVTKQSIVSSTNVAKSDRDKHSNASTTFLKPKEVKKKSSLNESTLHSDSKKGSKGSSKGRDEPTEPYDMPSDALIAAFLNASTQKAEAAPKIIRRTTGFDILDQYRIGPDVIDGDLECTPLPLYMSSSQIHSFSQILNQYQVDPETPKDMSEDHSLTTFDLRLYQQQSRSPAMSWNASLTTLEEEEFTAETELTECYKTIHNLPAEDETEKVYLQKMVNITNVDGSVSTKRRVRIVLTECETTFVLELAGKYELETMDNYEDILKQNERYKTMVQHHLESDAYSSRFAQTFENRSRNQWTEYKSPAACDVAVQANFYMIEDEYEAVAEAEAKRKIREEDEAQIRMLQERLKVERDAIDAIHNSDEDDSDEDDKLSVLSTIDWTKYGAKYEDDDDEGEEDDDAVDLAEKEFDLSENEDEFDTNFPLHEVYERQQKKNEAATLTVLPDISMGVVFMDRLISMEYMQDNQADMRGFPILNANLDANDKKDNKPHFFNLIEENRGKGQAQLDLGPNIKRYWSLRSPVTKGREVTDIALHNLNGNIVAASYGSNRFGDDEEGMVCVWSAKNTFYPERIYEFKSSVTCLAFANLTPYLLAVGMLDGNLAVYDVRASQAVAMSSTIGSQDKHEGPIWQVTWFQETEMATTGTVNEILLSLGDDGRLNRWTSTKGFDFVTMLRVRRSPLRIPGRRERRAEALTSNLSVAFSLCFYPDDWTQYLIGTEEGFIHKCSTSFTEQFVATYIGHSGPVYRITFSSSDKTIFVSASADWSVKVWKEGTYTPLLSMQTGLRTMFDVTCCPTMSSVFVCASEFHVEVWDLTLNTLEPVVQFAPPFAVAFRRAAYSSYLNSVILGDDEGAITFYGLRDFPNQSIIGEDQIDQVLEGKMPDMWATLEEDTKPTEETT